MCNDQLEIRNVIPNDADAEQHATIVSVMIAEILKGLNCALPVGDVAKRVWDHFGKQYGISNINWWRMRCLPSLEFEDLVRSQITE